tara:strand:+ start:208 stop:669 length:462 start_codon:yes stop_codon:yes gene_type:complete
MQQYKNEQLTVITSDDGNIELIRLLSYPRNRSHIPWNKVVPVSDLRREIACHALMSKGDRELAKSLSESLVSSENLVTDNIKCLFKDKWTRIFQGFNNGYGSTTLIFYRGRSMTHNGSFLSLGYAMEKLGFGVDDIKPLFQTLEELGFKVQEI